MPVESIPAYSTLIATKQLPPPVPGSLVPRPNLTQRLHEVIHRKLTILSAAAGCGKTTLLCEWLELRKTLPGLAVSWLTLDAADNDPLRFWQYILSALEIFWPRKLRDLSHLLETCLPHDLETFLIPLINTLTRLTVPDAGIQDKGSCHYALVLDDYHTIQLEEIHQSVAFFIDYLPAPIHLIIASRSYPPFNVGLLRARNQLIEISNSDLRFDNLETAQFFEQRMGIQLSPDEVDSLQKRIEGWAAGLQLSAISIGQEGDVKGFLQKVDGSDANISDFLVAEILNRLPQEIHQFLLETAILDRFCGPLCDYVTQRSGSQAVIDELVRANLFILPLDSRKNWYRYQHLIASLLLNRLQQTAMEQISLLHQRASQWFETNRMPGEAIHHAIAAQDFEPAINLLEQNYRIFVNRSSATFSSYIEAVPEEFYPAHPLLYLIRAWSMLGREQLALVEQLIQAAERAVLTFPPDQAACLSARLKPEIAVIRAVAAGQRSSFVNGAQIANQARLQVPDSDLFLKSWAQYAAGPIYSRSDDLTTSIKALNEAWFASRAMQNPGTEMISKYFLANQYKFQGKLHKAKEIYDQTLIFSGQNNDDQKPYAGLARIGLADLLREWNDLSGAREILQVGIEKIKSGHSTVFLADGNFIRARIHQSEGDYAGALRILEDTSLLIRQHGAIRGAPEIEAYLARLQLFIGNKKAAVYWAQSTNFSADQGNFPLRHIQQITLARIYAAQGLYDEALKILTQLMQQAEMSENTGSLIEVLILRAVILYTHKQDAHTLQAIQALQQALELAEPEGYVRIFADEGQPVRSILTTLLETPAQIPQLSSKLLGSAKVILNAIQPNQPSMDGFDDPQNAAPTDLLTGREIEVCRLLLYGYSNQEIAQTLFISENTVHTHRKKIYDKLGIHSRRQLINKMKALDLT